MMTVLKSSAWTILCAFALNAVAGIDAARAEKCEQPSRIRFSMVPLGDVERDIRLYQPLFKRIERMTGRSVQVVRPNSYASVVESLLSGGVDIAALGSATYLEAKKGDDSAHAFATTEKRAGEFQVSGPYYHSMLLVRADSRFVDLAALKGASLSLTDPGSTSGSLLPRKQLSPRLGASLEGYFGKVSFSGSHEKSLQTLLRGEVDAAFVSSAQLEKAGVTRKMVRILWTSDPIPYDPFVYRGQLCESLRKQIRAAFLGDEATANLRELLDARGAERFIPIDDSHYQGIRKALQP